MPRWTLENLIDFEQALRHDPNSSSQTKAEVQSAIRGKDGVAARREGLKVWLAANTPDPSAGRRFAGALSLVAFLLGVLAWLAGISGVLGLLDRSRGGIDVVLFLAILLGVQWLILLGAMIGWMFRHRAGEGFSAVQTVVGRLVRKLSGSDSEGWWHRIMDSGSAPRAALLWRIARLVQGAGVLFNIGIICGLAGLVMVRNVGFFWETTTEAAMRDILANVVKGLSFPWSGFWKEATPNAALIDASRWLPERSGVLPPGPAAWWLFLLAATFVWGLLPRLCLWFLARRATLNALDAVDFQARHHRALWRDLTGIERTETADKPLDGVLVLDVGGSGFQKESLRPFLLQKLRVNPVSWRSTAVLDTGAEQEATSALASAPAGVVLLAEGWSLSPPRMAALHEQIRKLAGIHTPVIFLIANEQKGLPTAITEEEKQQWERFVDSLRDPHAEVYFHP